MASKFYGKGLRSLLDGTIDYLTATIKVMIVNDGYTFDADHEFISDVVANEVTASGYVGGFAGAGRKTLAGKTVTDDTANNRIEFDCSDVVWTALGAGDEAAAVIVVWENTNDAASRVVAHLDPADLVLNGSDVTLVVNAEGLLQISYA